jgi:hypothetical protein
MLVAAVFVSYSRESEAAVRTLAADVEALEHTVWFDHDLSGGKVWWDQILAEIRDCAVFMIALSPDSLRSVACTSEYGYAADLGKPILPILITDGVSMNLLPPKLSQIQFVDYRKQDKTSAINLARALKTLPPAAHLPEPLPAPPPAPLSYLGRITEQIDSGKPLDHKDQSALVSELRRGLRDAETEADARSLLQRLRKRDDLFARIGDEIDELLENSENEPDAGRPRSEPPRREPKAEAPRVATPAVEPRAEHVAPPGISYAAPAAGGRLVSAMVGAGLGIALGLFVAETHYLPGTVVIPPAIGGAIAGAISIKRAEIIRRAIVGGVVGGIAIFVVALLLDADSEAFPIAVIFGVPLGAALGAAVGALIRKVRG